MSDYVRPQWFLYAAVSEVTPDLIVATKLLPRDVMTHGYWFPQEIAQGMRLVAWYYTHYAPDEARQELDVRAWMAGRRRQHPYT